MFVHDSLHTYDHMTAEYTIGYGALEEGGLLVSDDIGMNEAWSDFTRAKALDGRQLAKGRDGSQPFGYARKGRTSGGPAT